MTRFRPVSATRQGIELTTSQTPAANRKTKNFLGVDLCVCAHFIKKYEIKGFKISKDWLRRYISRNYPNKFVMFHKFFPNSQETHASMNAVAKKNRH